MVDWKYELGTDPDRMCSKGKEMFGAPAGASVSCKRKHLSTCAVIKEMMDLNFAGYPDNLSKQRICQFLIKLNRRQELYIDQ